MVVSQNLSIYPQILFLSERNFDFISILYSTLNSGFVIIHILANDLCWRSNILLYLSGFSNPIQMTLQALSTGTRAPLIPLAASEARKRITSAGREASWIELEKVAGSKWVFRTGLSNVEIAEIFMKSGLQTYWNFSPANWSQPERLLPIFVATTTSRFNFSVSVHDMSMKIVDQNTPPGHIALQRIPSSL